MLPDPILLQGSTMATLSKGAGATAGSSNTTNSEGASTGNGIHARSHGKPLNGPQSGSTGIPPPKTDKPRPHICTTCNRSFARLEHLKRHERSHTKEKPFECPECTRCFARRDLLLRHQQKLHLTAMPTNRQRGARRESASSTTASASSVRARKSSVANNAVGGSGGLGGASMRPRANTISHVDKATIGMLAATDSPSVGHEDLGLGPNHHPGMNGLPGVGGFNFRGMSTAMGHHGNLHGLPKLDTNGLNVSASLRTAPPYGGSGGEIDMESLWFGPGSTVNPAQLHFSNSPQSLTFETPALPYHQGFPSIPPAHATLDDDGNFTWLNGFDSQVSPHNVNEQAVDGSSPSVISTGSHSALSEVMLDGSANSATSSSAWQNSVISQEPSTTSYSMDWPVPIYQDVFPSGQLSPKSLHAHMANNDQYFSSPPSMSIHTPTSAMYGLNSQYAHPPMITKPETPSNSAASVSSSNRHSSVTSISTESITDATRQALLANLSHLSGYKQNLIKASQPQMISTPQITLGNTEIPLPNTYDLQRYISSYIEYFHPHLPFLHIPSFLMSQASSAPFDTLQAGSVNNKSPLILAMAAIGALYDYDVATSKELSEMAKQITQHYLEESRRAQISSEPNGSTVALWVVQAVALNVIYSHQCGDEITPGSAGTSCAVLVNLVREAELTVPSSGDLVQTDFMQATNDNVQLSSDTTGSRTWNMSDVFDQDEWLNWIVMEERKRTLYTVFTISSILVSDYNHSQALTHSEIRLDLPCDEELWAADSAESWVALGGAVAAEQKAVSFASALSYLLTANQRQQQQPQPCNPSIADHPISFNSNITELPESDLKPSTFGCLVLINALHNYIWETKQRHAGRQWTNHETEAMHAHVEPALKAWQAAWATNPQHSIQRPNPFGCGPLSADCIPLLDLAYIKLSTDLEGTKEAFWQRGHSAIVDDLAQSKGTTQLPSHPANPNCNYPHPEASNGTTNGTSPTLGSAFVKAEHSDSDYEPQFDNQISFPRHERHLRKAASYAANSLIMSIKLNFTFLNFGSRELPAQSAMSVSNAAQALAEWVSLVQDRVGRFLGILGKDEIDFRQVPGIMLIDDEDCKLLDKIKEFIDGVYAISRDITLSENSTANEPRAENYGYGSKVLLITAFMLRKAPVWPVHTNMALALEKQAVNMMKRAQTSLSND